MYQRHPALERPERDLFHEFMTACGPQIQAVLTHQSDMAGLPIDSRKISLEPKRVTFSSRAATGIKPAR